jgi:NhaP-type Na+/H+ or K+/H+ antiporter
MAISIITTIVFVLRVLAVWPQKKLREKKEKNYSLPILVCA